MSTYVMSDIHGNYKGYRDMLKLINFSDSDMLYVVGDVVDRGTEGIRILQDMMQRFNVIPILGNHEYMMVTCADFLLREMTEESVAAVENDSEILQGLMEWMEVGGSTTISEMKKLSDIERDDIMEYLDEFTLYETVKVNGREFIMVHAGLSNFARNRRLEDYRLDELIFEAPDYNKVYFDDKYLITGHLPTRVIWKNRGGVSVDGNPDRIMTEVSENIDSIFMRNNHIAIDCASGYPGGRLGCLRLDDFKEFYV